MATLEVKEESLVWLYNKLKENHVNMADLSQFVKSLGLSSACEPIGLEVNKNNVVIEKQKPDNRPFTSLGANANKSFSTSANVMASTLKVLFHLKTLKNEFVAVEFIPALQGKDWSFTGELTEYLLKKNFIKVKGIDARIYLQITQFGLQYLHACEATAC
ncbi:hypothetical protein HUW51_02215 [Adhaeribacter swui]|uniref:Uncharacterized protein n=1 Tax=Adhaeribacter swui TaxID=2086471 RepID=A0A7G7G361_9BACT|nr:hypothetical protein [Adhaeribacter swui]QNF31595.1 hypothetical protein HUW51_02215 [Adhaeribacter swui]